MVLVYGLEGGGGVGVVGAGEGVVAVVPGLGERGPVGRCGGGLPGGGGGGGGGLAGFGGEVLGYGGAPVDYRAEDIGEDCFGGVGQGHVMNRKCDDGEIGSIP